MGMARCDAELKERLQLALDLFITGEAMMRQNLRRRLPSASEEEVERRLVEWLQSRPGAEGGDAPGRVLPWPLPRR